MEIDATVPDTYTASAFQIPPPDDPYVADLLQVADAKIAQLESEVARIEDEKEVMERKLTMFRQQVSHRWNRGIVFAHSDNNNNNGHSMGHDPWQNLRRNVLYKKLQKIV